MILAIDIGTSRVKGALFDEEGKAIGRRSVPVAMSDSADPSAHEIESGAWVAAVRDIATILGGDVEAVVISGNGPTLLPVDAEGKPLQAALSWMDRRATAQAARASAAAGIPIDSSWTLPKALWIKERRPEIYEKTAAFLSCPEYLMRLLTGESATIVPSGYEPYYGTPEIFAALGLESAKFPPSVRPGRFSARVTEAGQARLGIPAGALAIAAGPDYLAALIGTATTVPGRACDRAGTSEGVNLCAERGVNDPRLISVPHIVEPFANISGLISTTGAAMAWWKAGIGPRGVPAAQGSAARGGAPGSYDDLFDAPFRGSCRGERPRVPSLPLWRALPDMGHGRARGLHRPRPLPRPPRDGAGCPRVIGLRDARRHRSHGGRRRHGLRAPRHGQAYTEPPLEPGEGRTSRAAPSRCRASTTPSFWATSPSPSSRRSATRTCPRPPRTS